MGCCFKRRGIKTAPLSTSHLNKGLLSSAEVVFEQTRGREGSNENVLGRGRDDLGVFEATGKNPEA